MLKLVHVLGVIAFVGNIVVGIFWKNIADRTHDPRVIAHTISGIIVADRIFTFPGILLILIGGFGAAAIARYSIWGTGWVLWGLGLFVIAGICFGPVQQAQRAMLRLTQEAQDAKRLDWQAYARLTTRWNAFGTIATVAPLLAVVVMVLKPHLPAF